MIEAADLWRLIDAADAQMRAMILLALNAGYGNTDCATLPLSAIDLDCRWVSYTRPKTGVPRRAPLWPETVAALREAITLRPKPDDYAACWLAFLTERGTRLVRAAKATSRADVVAVRFGGLLKRTGLHRAGLGFYTLRHVFRTIADGARDQVATDLIMGHADPSMAGHYRERIDDARLIAVTDHVRAWLLAGKPAGEDRS
jgi:integrase